MLSKHCEQRTQAETLQVHLKTIQIFWASTPEILLKGTLYMGRIFKNSTAMT